MKSTVARILACASLLLAAGAALWAQGAAENETATKLLGTWRMVSQKTGDAQDYTDVPKEKMRLKLLAPAGSVWVEFESETGKVLTCVAGTWSAQGTEYKEKATLGMGPAYEFLRDKDPVFVCKLDGNKWNHTGTIGTWKGDENWELQAAAQESDDKELAAKLVGVWRLVAANENGGEVATDIPKERQTELRYVTATHFLGLQFEAGTTTVASCTGGTWSLRAGEIRQKIDCGLGERALALRGTELALSVKLEGDRCQEAGTVAGAKVVQVWERVKPE